MKPLSMQFVGTPQKPGNLTVIPYNEKLFASGNFQVFPPPEKHPVEEASPASVPSVDGNETAAKEVAPPAVRRGRKPKIDPSNPA